MHMDLAYTSMLFLGVSVVVVLVAMHFSDAWLYWSEFNFMLALFLLFVLTTASFWVHDCILLVLIMDMLHLIMALFILTDVALHRMLLFLTSGWVLTMLVMLSFACCVSYGGDADLYHVLHTNMQGYGYAPNIFYMLMLGKLYIMPASLMLMLLYSSFQLDMLMMVTLLFTIHFTSMLITVLSDVASVSMLWMMVMLTTCSFIVVTAMFVEASDMSVFIGLSYAAVLHMTVLLSVLPGTRVCDLLSPLLTAYILLATALFMVLRSMRTKAFNFSALAGYATMNSTASVVLLVVLFAFLGVPPSVIFLLKMDYLATAYLYLGVMWGLLAVLGVVAGLVYMRLMALICATSASAHDCADVSAAMGTCAPMALGLVLCMALGL